MRLWMTRGYQLLRHPGSTPFAKHALAECAKSDANRRFFSSFNAPRLPPAFLQHRTRSGANGIAPTCAVGDHLLLKPTYNPTLEFLRAFRYEDRPRRPREDERVFPGERVVAVSSEVWRLLQEHNVPAAIRSTFNVHIQATPPASKQVQLTLRGRKPADVAALLADPPRQLDVHELVAIWLISEGPNGLRAKDIRMRTGAFVNLSRDKKSVLLLGPSNATLKAKSIIDECDYVGEVDVDSFVGFYLVNNNAYHLKRLSAQTDALMSPKPADDGTMKWNATVVGPTEGVKRLKRKLDELHIKRRQIPQAVCWWLTNPGKGAEDTRSTELELKYGTCIYMGPHKEDNDPARLVELVVVGEWENSVDDALATIDECDCIEEFDIDHYLGFYLINDDAFHQNRLSVETDALILATPGGDATKWKAQVVGPTECVKRLKRKLDGLYVKRRRVPQAVCTWLTGNGAECARAVALNRKFETSISTGPLTESTDPARLVDLFVVGERETSVDGVFAIIDRLHGKRLRTSVAVLGWLTNASKGARCSRTADLERKYDAHIAMEALGADTDPARAMDLAVVGEREENVDRVFAEFESIVVERLTFTKLHAEFWLGHDDEQQRNRPKNKLEDSTDTHIQPYADTDYVYVTGRPEGVKCAMERLRKSQHIKLRTGPARISLAAAVYVASIRHKFENDDVQIHLRYVGMRPGTCELRRLHRVDRDQDDAKADEVDRKLMHAIDLHEVVLDVHESWARFLGQQCAKNAFEGVGIHVSNDVVNGRVLVNIAGSRDTVRRGADAVVRMLARERPQWVSDVRLRRIEGQPVVTAGFEQADSVGEEDLSHCAEPFEWERLTREQWRYAGRSPGERKQSTNPKRNKTSENPVTNRA